MTVERKGGRRLGHRSDFTELRLRAPSLVTAGERCGRMTWMDADVIVVGGGLAGLVAAAELADAGKRVIVVDQEPEQSLGGQAFWSLGGLFLVDYARAAPAGHQGLVRAGPRGLDGDGRLSTAEEDYWPRQWAEAYVAFAAGEKRGRGCTSRACAGFRSWAGPSAAAMAPSVTAIRCRDFISPGAPGPACSSLSCAGARGRERRGRSPSSFATASTSSSSPTARSTACAARSSSPATSARGSEQLAQGGR